MSFVETIFIYLTKIGMVDSRYIRFFLNEKSFFIVFFMNNFLNRFFNIYFYRKVRHLVFGGFLKPLSVL